MESERKKEGSLTDLVQPRSKNSGNSERLRSSTAVLRQHRVARSAMVLKKPALQ